MPISEFNRFVNNEWIREMEKEIEFLSSLTPCATVVCQEFNEEKIEQLKEKINQIKNYLKENDYDN